MGIRIALSALVLLLAIPPSLLAQGAANDTLIVPGERVGPVRIGMTLVQLRAAIGDPVRSVTLAKAKSHLHYYSDRGLSIVVRASDNRVTDINVEGSQYRTAQGLFVGSRIFAVRAALRPPVKEWLYSDGSYGIICSPFVNFWYDRAGVVTSITNKGKRWTGCG